MQGIKRNKKELHPEGKWTCPSCNAKHDFPHWKDHHQANKVEDKDFCEDGCKESDESSEFEEDGYTPKSLYCPACSWEEPRVQLIKLKRGEVLEIA